MTPVKVLTSTSHFCVLNCAWRFSNPQGGGATRGLAAEPCSRGRFWVSTTAHRRNALVAVGLSISGPDNSHSLVRFEPSEAFSYVALRGSFALSGRGLRIQHHISGKAT